VRGDVQPPQSRLRRAPFHAERRMMDDDRAREFVLEAAALMVQEGGAELLSHQAVAEAAGLPEARVRRLFPTIEALVTVMVDRLPAAFLDAVAEACGEDDSPGAWLRAYVRVGFALDEDADLPRLARALLCSVAYRPHMLDAVREREVEIQHQIANSGIPPERAVVVCCRPAPARRWSGSCWR
jgi:AcrR family transcriptional regulator